MNVKVNLLQALIIAFFEKSFFTCSTWKECLQTRQKGTLNTIFNTLVPRIAEDSIINNPRNLQINLPETFYLQLGKQILRKKLAKTPTIDYGNFQRIQVIISLACELPER